MSKYHFGPTEILRTTLKINILVKIIKRWLAATLKADPAESILIDYTELAFCDI